MQSLNVLFCSSVANKAFEVRLEEMDGERAKTEEKLKERIAELEKELENANELLSDGKRRGKRVNLVHQRLIIDHHANGWKNLKHAIEWVR